MTPGCVSAHVVVRTLARGTHKVAVDPAAAAVRDVALALGRKLGWAAPVRLILNGKELDARQPLASLVRAGPTPEPPTLFAVLHATDDPVTLRVRGKGVARAATVTLAQGASVAELKRRLAADGLVSLSPGEQKLVLGGRTMRDSLAVAEYGPGRSPLLVLAQPDPRKEVTLHVAFPGRGQLRVSVELGYSIAQLKAVLQRAHAVPASVSLMLDGKTLAPERTLLQCGVADGAVLQVLQPLAPLALSSPNRQQQRQRRHAPVAQRPSGASPVAPVRQSLAQAQRARRRVRRAGAGGGLFSGMRRGFLADRRLRTPSPPTVTPPVRPGPPAPAAAAAPALVAAMPADGGGDAHCAECSKRLRAVAAATGRCRCGRTFCEDHAGVGGHVCDFDYVQMSREQLQRMNPSVLAPKVNRI